MIFRIKSSLKQKQFKYPKFYSKNQTEQTKQILTFFKEVSLGISGEKVLETQLKDKNTAVIVPIPECCIIGISNIPVTHKAKWKNSRTLIIKPKRKFKNQFPQALIINATHQAS